MPAQLAEKSSSSPAAATPVPCQATPDKPRPASSEQQRKSSKPLMEKRRRARINASLGQLKSLLLDALHKDSSRPSKLEKADILEMAVKHLRGLQRAQVAAALNTGPSPAASVLGKYRAGFHECLNEVTRFLSTCEGVTAEVRTRLLGHLAVCLSHISAVNCCPAPPQQQQPPAASAPQHGPSSLGQQQQQPRGQVPAGAAPPAGNVAPCKLACSAGDGAKVCRGFQLVLPALDGQFAFLIPNASFAPPGGAGIPPSLYANGGELGSGLPPPAVSPPSGAPPALPTDLVWRPW